MTPLFEDALSEAKLGAFRFSREESGEVCGLTVRYGAQVLEFSRLR